MLSNVERVAATQWLFSALCIPNIRAFPHFDGTPRRTHTHTAFEFSGIYRCYMNPHAFSPFRRLNATEPNGNMVKLNFASNFSFGFCKSFAPVRYINLYQYQRAAKKWAEKIVAESNRVWLCVVESERNCIETTNLYLVDSEQPKRVKS